MNHGCSLLQETDLHILPLKFPFLPCKPPASCIQEQCHCPKVPIFVVLVKGPCASVEVGLLFCPHFTSIYSDLTPRSFFGILTWSLGLKIGQEVCIAGVQVEVGSARHWPLIVLLSLVCPQGGSVSCQRGVNFLCRRQAFLLASGLFSSSCMRFLRKFSFFEAYCFNSLIAKGGAHLAWSHCCIHTE